jgi:predicted NUDIX family NTP pyrophosphohydrolase
MYRYMAVVPKWLEIDERAWEVPKGVVSVGFGALTCVSCSKIQLSMF